MTYNVFGGTLSPDAVISGTTILMNNSNPGCNYVFLLTCLY